MLVVAELCVRQQSNDEMNSPTYIGPNGGGIDSDDEASRPACFIYLK